MMGFMIGAFFGLAVGLWIGWCAALHQSMCIPIEGSNIPNGACVTKWSDNLITINKPVWLGQKGWR